MLAIVTQAAPVVHTVVQQVQVPVTPSWVGQLETLGSLIVPGYLASFLHSILTNKSSKLQQDEFDWLNAGLLFVYSFAISALVLYFQGRLSVQNPEAFAGAFVTVLGAASLRYNILKLSQSSADTSSPSQATASASVSTTESPIVY